MAQLFNSLMETHDVTENAESSGINTKVLRILRISHTTAQEYICYAVPSIRQFFNFLISALPELGNVSNFLLFIVVLLKYSACKNSKVLYTIPAGLLNNQ